MSSTRSENRLDDGLVVVGQSETITIPLSQIASLERRDGTRGRTNVGALVGLGAGLVVGAIARGCPPESNIVDEVMGAFCESFDVLVIPMLGFAGALAGALVGTMIRTDNRNLSTTMGHSTGLIREQCPVW